MDTVEKRKYERVLLPENAGAYVADSHGKRIGALRVVGQGGILCQCDPKLFKPGQIVLLSVVDQSEGIDRHMSCEVRYADESGVGFAFEDLGPESAVEIGVIIGKYYAAAKK
jgi:hypothetical protein